MTRQWLLPVAFVAAALSCFSKPLPAGGGASIRYHVSIPDPSTEEFLVTVRIKGLPRDTMTFLFPIWAPGAYDIVNFGAYVHDVTAISRGKRLVVLRGDTNTFRIVGGGEEIDLQYRVHDIEKTDASSWYCISDIEPDMAFAVGVALFGYPSGHKDVPFTVEYDPPPGWDLAVALDPDGKARTFRARDYDELVDAPVQMGKFRTTEFTVGGKPHIITFTAPEPLPDSLVQMITERTKRVVELLSGFFGDLPYERYLFQHFFVDPSEPKYDYVLGALEHANSSTYLSQDPVDSDIDYNEVPVIAHEYWHLWTPKRIHVRQLGPFDYQSPPRTSSLWFAEGITEYYARVLLVRSGLHPSQYFLGDMRQNIGQLYGRPQRRSIAELSLEISKLPIEQVVALYSQGPAIGLLLDAAIRSQTGNRKSLDDAMRYFNDEYGKKGRTFDDEEIIPIIERSTGARLQDFYQRFIAGREVLPFDEYLPKIGLRYISHPELRLGFGAKYTTNPLVITEVTPGGTADSMGVKVGDTLQTLRTTISGGRGVAVCARTDGREISHEMLKSIENVYYLEVDPEATPEVVRIRESMLGF